jgi:hypothetical protein
VPQHAVEPRPLYTDAPCDCGCARAARSLDARVASKRGDGGCTLSGGGDARMMESAGVSMGALPVYSSLDSASTAASWFRSVIGQAVVRRLNSRAPCEDRAERLQ